MWLYIYPLIYLTTIFFGIIYYSKYAHNKELIFFLIFLIYSLLTELFGNYKGRVLRTNTFYIYNTWNIVNHLFYMFFFLVKLNDIFKRRILISLIFLYVLLTVINVLFFENYITEGLINNIILGSLFILVSVMIYYSELLKKDEILEIQYSMFFWISIGVLIFNIGFLPIIVIAEFISYGGVYIYITLGLNILMSLCFITGFIMSKKVYNI